jgi:hypothetical protein
MGLHYGGTHAGQFRIPRRDDATLLGEPRLKIDADSLELF